MASEMQAILDANQILIRGDVGDIILLKKKLSNSINDINTFHSILNTFYNNNIYSITPQFASLVIKFNREYNTMMESIRFAQELRTAEIEKELDSLDITPSLRGLTRALERTNIVQTIRKRPSSKKPRLK